jgi:iron complex transport system ATP-binding protein
MDLTETAPLKEKKIAHLSGGERQRVFIARALAQDTPLLFLDEPSAHLDISYQVEIYRILKRLQEEKNKTILSAEHNINLAIPYSRRILFLKEGRIHSIGHPMELVTKQNIQEVFHTDVEVRKNLHSGFPEISLTFQKPEGDPK